MRSVPVALPGRFEEGHPALPAPDLRLVNFNSSCARHLWVKMIITIIHRQGIYFIYFTSAAKWTHIQVWALDLIGIFSVN